MTQKIKYPRLVTSIGVAAFSHITKPDSEGQYADNKYKTQLVLDANDPFLVKLKETCTIAAKLKWGKVPSECYFPGKDGDESADEAKAKGKDREDWRGKVILTAKSQFAPGCINAAKEPLAEGVEIRSGDKIRLSVVCFPYESSEKVKEGGKIKTVTSYGVSLQLRNVQLITKWSGQGNAADDFDDLDGTEGEATTEGGDADPNF